MNTNTYSERIPTPQTLPTIGWDDLIPSSTVDLRDVERACSRRPQLLRFFHRVEAARSDDRIGLLFSASSELGRLAFDDVITFNQALGALEHLAKANGAIHPSDADGSVDPADPVLVRLQQICGRAYLEHSGAANRSLIRRELERLRSTFAGATNPDFQAANEASERIAKGMAVSWGAEAFAVALDDDYWPTPSSILPLTIAASVMGVFSVFWTTPEDKALRRECMLIARRTINMHTQRRADLEFATEAAPAPQGPTAASIVLPINEASPILLPEALAKVAASEPPAAEVVPFPKPEPRSVEKPEDVLARKLDALTRPPGLVGDIVDWIEASSRHPSRILALGAALTFVGTLAGRMYQGPTGLRTNVYVLSLAPSGFGKEQARECVSTLAQKAGLVRFVGAARIKSDSGLRKAVEQQPSLMYMLDEFGGVMRQWADRRAATHIAQIRDLFLEYFSRAKTFYSGADYAESRGMTVHNPNVSIYGTSTPEDFYEAMNGASISDGFLPRFVCISALGERQPDRDPLLDWTSPPAALIEASRRLASVKPLGGNLVGSVMDGSTQITARVAPWAGGADQRFKKHKAACEGLATRGGGVDSLLWSRVPEHAVKLALIVAVGRDFDRPEIWPQDLDWAFELLSICTRNTIAAVDGRLAENEAQREYLFVRRLVAESGSSGVSKTEITRKVHGRFDSARIGKILAQLDEAGEIHSRTVQSAGGGPIQNRYLWREHMTLAA